MVALSVQQVADIFVEVADSLVSDFDRDEFLQTVTEHAATIGGVPGSCLLMADHDGQLRYTASSSDRNKSLVALQLEHREGPALDCFHNDRPVADPDLTRQPSRWPRYARMATDVGFRSVYSIPMHIHGQVIGALNLLGEDTAAVDDDQIHTVQSLLDVATIAILQRRTLLRAETLAEQLQGALDSRVIIEQAKGALAHANGITTEEAFALLRAHARRNRHRLVDLAAAVADNPDRGCVLCPSSGSRGPELTRRRHPE